MTMEALRLLLVEDSPGDARLIQELFRDASQPVDVTTASRLGNALDLIETEDFDVVLLDLFLPDSGGIETFETFQSRAPSVPVIVLTGLSDESLGVVTVKEGAQDYLPKSEVTTELLVRSIRYCIERHRTRQALEANEARMRALLNAVPQSIIIENSKGGIVMVNEQARRRFGYGLSELMGLSIEALIAPDGLERYRSARAAALESGGASKPVVGLHGQSKDGSRFPVEIGHSVVRTPIGQRVICLIDDVSAHHALVAELDGQSGARPDEKAPELDGAAAIPLERESAWPDELRR